MRRMMSLALGLSICLFAGNAWAQEAPQTKKKVKVGVAIFSPCVMKKDDQLVGFEMDLWRKIMKDLNLQCDFEVKKTEKGEVDVAFAGITMSSEREKNFDFTAPYLSSGLSIVVKEGSKNPLTEVSSPLVTRVLWLCLYFFSFVVLSAHIMWFAEQGREGLSDTYFPGILEAIWFTIVTSTTVGYGDFTPRSWISRAVCVLVMFGGVGFFGFVISEVTAALTTANLNQQIQYKDLSGKLVATQGGTIAEQYLKEIGAIPVAFKTVDEAFDKVASGEISFAVYDTPSAKYYIRTKGSGRIKIAGSPFYRHYLAIALPKGSPLREPISQSILRLKEKGDYERIHNEWFGEQ
ncbi:MAG: transporter substrate-binding domain-containing protein [Planctomycetota bacterium]|nr:transporter substrate-binding domain-containing protein [Planctomycetota bacterium]